jgi:2-hydroxy-3-keto-5-methylthiopentenyl-1-phosphate phosphatase
MPTPKKVAERLAAGLKRFQPILAESQSRDDGEADTVRIVTDMLADIFGYDKYSELTAEYAIKGTYCDLATKLDGKIAALIEVKAIGIELKEPHVKQAIDYAANQGVDWVVLTNGVTWRIYKVTFAKPIGQELIIEFDVRKLNHRAAADLDCLYLLCKEGWIKSVLGDYHTQRQALSRFFLGALLVSDSIVDVIRRELRRVSPDVKIESDQIREVLVNEVIKREVLDGEQAETARKKVARAANKSLRKTSSKAAAESNGDAESSETAEAVDG